MEDSLMKTAALLYRSPDYNDYFVLDSIGVISKD